ncbi:Ig-like domain-containing protein [Bifidobacterium sp. ESL0769]|nr:Ig-like domain-containing protein [Bifidobacterium sp. ESL0769]WEV67409.1 Ig-like domain-containing protein [Bifidobacterium sp. ESL0769]
MSGDIGGLFGGLPNLWKIDLTNATFEDITNTQMLFYDDRHLESADVSKIDFTSIPSNSMKSMFETCERLESINFGSNWSTSGVTSMEGMFAGTEMMRYPRDMFTASNGWHTESVTNMSFMFQNTNASELNLSNLNTPALTNTSYMFAGCGGLQRLDISNFSTDSPGFNATLMFQDSPIKMLKLGPHTRLPSGNGLHRGPYTMDLISSSPVVWHWHDLGTGYWSSEDSVVTNIIPDNGIAAPTPTAKWYGSAPNMSLDSMTSGVGPGDPDQPTGMPSFTAASHNGCWPSTHTCDVTLPTAEPHRNNFTFAGWKDTEDGANVGVNPPKLYHGGDTFSFDWERWNNWYDIMSSHNDGNHPADPDTHGTLVAQWTPLSFTNTEPTITGITQKPHVNGDAGLTSSTVTVSGTAPDATLGTSVTDSNRDKIEVDLMNTAGSTSTAPGDGVAATSVSLDMDGKWTATFPTSAFTLDDVGTGTDYSFRVRRVNHDDTQETNYAFKHGNTLDIVAPAFGVGSEKLDYQTPEETGSNGTLSGTLYTSGDAVAQSNRTKLVGATVTIHWQNASGGTADPDDTATTDGSGTFTINWPTAVRPSKAEVVVTDDAGNKLDKTITFSAHTPATPTGLALDTPLPHAALGVTPSGDIVLKGAASGHVPTGDVITATATRGGVTINSYGSTAWSGSNWSVTFHASDFATNSADSVGKGQTYTFTASRSISGSPASTADLTGQTIDVVAPEVYDLAVDTATHHTTVTGKVRSSANATAQSSREAESGTNNVTLKWLDSAGAAIGGVADTTASSDASGNFSATIPTGHTNIAKVKVQVKDAAGNTSAYVTQTGIVYSPSAPTGLELASPMPHATLGAAVTGDIVLKGTVSDHAISGDVITATATRAGMSSPINSYGSTTWSGNNWSVTFHASDFAAAAADPVGSGEHYTFTASRSISGGSASTATLTNAFVDVIAPDLTTLTVNNAAHTVTGKVIAQTGSSTSESGTNNVILQWLDSSNTQVGLDATVSSDAAGNFTATVPSSRDVTKVRVQVKDAAGNTSAKQTKSGIIHVASDPTHMALETLPKSLNGAPVTAPVILDATIDPTTIAGGTISASVKNASGTVIDTLTPVVSGSSVTASFPAATFTNATAKNYTFVVTIRNAAGDATATLADQSIDLVAPDVVPAKPMQTAGKVNGVVWSSTAKLAKEASVRLDFNWMKADGTSLATSTTSSESGDALGNFSALTPAAAKEARKVSVQATDAAGNTSATQTVNFTLPDPTLNTTIDIPHVNGSSLTGFVKLSGIIADYNYNAGDTLEAVVVKGDLSTSDPTTPNTRATSFTINPDGSWSAQFATSAFTTPVDSVGKGRDYTFYVRLVRGDMNSGYAHEPALIDLVAPSLPKAGMEYRLPNNGKAGKVFGKVYTSSDVTARQPEVGAKVVVSYTPLSAQAQDLTEAPKVQGAADVNMDEPSADVRSVSYTDTGVGDNSLLRGFAKQVDQVSPLVKDGVSSASGTVDSDGTFSIDWDPSWEQGGTVSVVAYDAAGNSSIPVEMQLGKAKKSAPLAHKDGNTSAVGKKKLVATGVGVTAIALFAALMLVGAQTAFWLSRKYANNAHHAQSKR